MRKVYVLAAAALTFGAVLAFAADSKPAGSELERVSWLAGTWAGKQGDTVVEEHWMAPRGTMMPGVHRDVGKSGRTSFEFLRILVTEDGVAFLASPGGRAPTTFMATEISETRAVFENLEHDFPQRIIYERSGKDGLNVAAEGDMGGEMKRISWTWKRVKK